MSDSAVKLWPHYEYLTGNMLFAPAFPYQTMPTYVSLDEIAQFVSATPITIATPANGGTVFMTGSLLFVGSGPLDGLIIRLPPDSAVAEICFAAPVASLAVEDAAGDAVAGAPASAYGPGAALQFRYVDRWRYWK